ADKDHFGGVESVLNEVEVHHVYLPYQATLASEEAYLSLYQTALKKAFTVAYSERYMHIQGENYFLMFLSPKSPSFTEGMEDNEASAVVWLDYLGTSVLFAGDMTNQTEASLLHEYTLLDGIFDLKDMHVNLESTEILKVAHHGSAYSSSLPWLELLNAETAIISCGAGNSYGHPSSQALENLRIANPDTQIYRTDECGTIVLTATGKSTYATVYENQSAASAAVFQEDGLLGLAYIKTKSSFTENFLA
ncbi:MAG: hypothetical protein IJY26_00315, partial [Clostridia bacterium]|nr:hypothetical protein [Clostridia bacterium]